MNPDLETAISGENEAPSHRLRWLLLVLFVSILAFATTVWYLQSSPTAKQAKQEKALNEQLQQLVEKYKNRPFEFTLVPDALTTITLPPPPDSNTADLESYQVMEDQLTPDMIDRIDRDTVLTAFTIDGFKYGEFLDYSPDKEKIYQLHDEIRHLVLNFNKQYQRPSLSERLPDIEHYGTEYPAVPGNNDVLPIYPSVRAAEGFAVAALLTRLDIEHADFYQDIAEDYAKRGIMYGWYGESDIEAARSIVNQYFTQLDQSDYISTLTNI